MQFSHTSGRTQIISQYKEMGQNSQIELFKETRVSKKRGSGFVNDHAQLLYDEMVELKRHALDKDGEPLSEAEIVKSVLGERSGYVKGMGHGVDVPCGSSSKVVAGTNLKEKLIELDNAKEKIRDLTDAYEDQNKTLENQRIAMDACEEKCSETMNAMQAQLSKLQQFIKKIPSIPSYLFQD